MCFDLIVRGSDRPGASKSRGVYGSSVAEEYSNGELTGNTPNGAMDCIWSGCDVAAAPVAGSQTVLDKLMALIN